MVGAPARRVLLAKQGEQKCKRVWCSYDGCLSRLVVHRRAPGTAHVATAATRLRWPLGQCAASQRAA